MALSACLVPRAHCCELRHDIPRAPFRRCNHACMRDTVQTGPGGVGNMDGADAEVEMWDDLRAGAAEPILVGRSMVPGQQYKDLLALKQVRYSAVPT